MKKNYVNFCILFTLFFTSYVGASVHTSYLWHLQQPNYWPEKHPNLNRYMNAAEQLDGLSKYPGHPQNNLADIFGKDDRRFIYQWRSKDSVASMNLPDAGAQLIYPGDLIENIDSLGKSYKLGYSPNWASSIKEAASWKTTTGRSKLKVLGFSFHHALLPLIDPDARKKEIALDREMWKRQWGANLPKGFRTSEEAFSTRIIKDLVEAGYEWVVVPNHHLARTHSNYQANHHKGLYDPPNKADQINKPGKNFWSGEIDGRGATLSVPFSYQAHYAKYVDPADGREYKIIVVPMADILSYRDGYSSQGTDFIDRYIAPFSNPAQPSFILFSHDGDNAWGGGYSYYHEAVPKFVHEANNKGYRPTTIQTFLDRNPPPKDDLVHVEDGAWVNAAGDWGHPQFLNWLWYPQRDRKSPEFNHKKPETYADIENGWAEDFRNWAVLIAAQNYVSTAEQVTLDRGEGVFIDKILRPTGQKGYRRNANDAELAWHFYLPGLTSGYMYYGAALDMEVKPTLASNQAVYYAQKALGKNFSDRTAPTIFIPQRYPYNPGSENYGAQYGYQKWIAPSDFKIWTFAYDVSKIERIVLKIRVDEDGVNPIHENSNEVYTHKSVKVSAWKSINMSIRRGNDFVENIFNDGNIDFFIKPGKVADMYFADVKGYKDKLLDYYIEAHDVFGNIKRTDIQHVYVD